MTRSETSQAVRFQGNRPQSDRIVAPVAGLLDTVITDPAARDDARARLAELDGDTLDRVHDQLAAVLAEDASADRWSSRARPTFLYVMYALLLWSIPMGLIAAVHPALAQAIAHGMNTYLAGLPEPLYALFGTGYLGYTVAREWGRAKRG